MDDTLTCAIIGHLVGDYLLQNDWMALNKKRVGSDGRAACFVHCWLWAGMVCGFAGWWSYPIFSLLFVLHYAQDRTSIIARWMSAIGQEQFRTGPCAPWSIIVVDNVWHIVALWAVWKYAA